jgi:triosephosphate isomerase
MIAGNWKMNTTVEEAVALVKDMLPELDRIEGAEKVVCPPFVSLVSVSEVLRGSSVKLGAQNLYFEEKGAYTGEISPLMLAGLCEYVIIGHSERRQYFDEGREIINRKLRATLKAGLKPILCVGEKLEENEAGKTAEVVTAQINSALDGLNGLEDLTVAYEPIWAIGTGRAATSEQSNQTIGLIRSQVARLSDEKLAQGMRILYGGSVTADNIGEFIQQGEIDGALVGGASLKSDQFVSIVRQSAEIGG